ncbi:hypothetical protein D6833_00425 [Candidatus Parcubacteria bacterium]|nr:MAG: hypothetical protein D6833_00425 [Candidatus Parcubacteria bacterium]
MGYRELFLVLTTILIFSLLSANVNQTMIGARETLQEIEIAEIGISIAQGFIEEAKSKKFDALVGSLAPPDMPGNFTPWSNLGPEAGEAYPNFDDVDDFNGLNQVLNYRGLDFTVSVAVNYVMDINPDSTVQTQTYFKRMKVSVNSSWMNGQVELRRVFSYYGSEQ